MKISKNSKGIGWEKENDVNIDGGNIDLSSYAKKTDLPTKTSQLDNDSNFASRSELPLENSVKMVAHRGFSTHAPENTIPAYELAGMHGYWGAECDLQQTSDGHFVLMHDLTVDRTTNGTGNVADMTLEQIKALNIDITMTKWASGTVKVPTLEEYLICCKKYNLVPVIEIKSGLNMENFIQIIREHNMEDKCIVISFSNEVLISLRALSDIIKIQTLTFVSLDHCLANNFDIDIDYGNAWLTESNIKEAHTKGIEINVWTVDNITNMKNLINIGVDYVTTNRLNTNNNAHNRVCTLEDNHLKDEMDITTLKAIYTNSVDFEEMSIDYLVRTVKDANYKLVYPEYLPIQEGSGFRVRSKAFNAMGCLDYKIQYDDVNYKLTIYPFNSNNLMIADLGWFTNNSLISLPKDTKFFVLFCGKIDDSNFTDDEITTLMNSIKLTRMNVIKDDNAVSEPIHPTVIRYGTSHPSISTVGTESAGSTQNNNRCFDNIKHQVQGNKFILTFDSSKIGMTALPCNGSSYTDLGWLESGKEYDIPIGTQWVLLYYKPTNNSTTFSAEQQQAVLNSSIKFKGVTVVAPSKYQTRTDENLNTKSKDIVGAINELNSRGEVDITPISRSFTVNVPSSVLINPNDGYMQGKKISGGGIVDDPDYNITSFIPVSPGDAIVISHLNRMFWCNASKVKFDQQQQGDTTNYSCSNSNSNLAYIRFSYRAEFEEQLSVSINGTPLPSESFTHELTPNAYELPNMVSTKFYKDARENDASYEGVDIFSIEGGTVKKPNSEENATFYRIPALTVSTHGTLIAFTDVRFDAAADQGGRISIWCRRSEDKGRTWGDAIEVCKYPVGDNGDAASTRARAMDSTVISASNGKIFCLNGAWKSNGGNWSTIQLTPDTDWILKLSVSKDDGLSWETKNLFVGDGAVATNLTGMPSTVVSCLGGVGQGIEMYNGTLVFPLQLTLRENSHNDVCATIMYSEDGGKNWRIAGGFAPATSGEDNVVEIEPGVILMNARNGNARQTFITYDMGATWEVYTPMNGKIGNGGVGCQGSSTKFKFDNGHEVFLHSSPINRAGNYTRDSITLYASYDWENYDKIVTYYPQAGNGAGAGYSCLAPAIIDGKQCLFAVYERQGNIAFRNLSNYLEEIENRANKFFASADRTFDMSKVDLLKLLDIDLITLKAIIKEYKDGTLGVPKDPILQALNEAMTVSLVGLEGGHVIDEGNVEKAWTVNANSLTWDSSLGAFDFGKSTGNSIYTENYNPNINFTIDFDVYIDGAPGVNWTFIFAIANTTDQPGFGLGINSTNTWNPAVDGSGSATYTESSFVGRWIHITATKSSTQGVVIYQDNTSVYTKAEGTHSVAQYSRFTVGNNCALAKAFDGKIANFKVFNKVVSEEERTYLFNHGKSAPSA